MKRYLEKLDQGTHLSDFSKDFEIMFNRFDNSYKAGYQSLRDFRSTVCAKLKVHQTTMAKFDVQIAQLNVERNQLFVEKAQLTKQNIQLVAANIKLAAQKAQLTVEMSGMEKNNEQLTKASIQTEIEKKELLEKIDRQKTVMYEERSKLKFKISEKNNRLIEFQALNDQLSAKLVTKGQEEENEREKLQESIIELFKKKKN